MFREIRLLFSTFSARFSVVYLYVHGIPDICPVMGMRRAVGLAVVEHLDCRSFYRLALL